MAKKKKKIEVKGQVFIIDMEKDSPTVKPLKNIPIELVDAESGRVLKKTKTSKKGKYTLSRKVPEGQYRTRFPSLISKEGKPKLQHYQGTGWSGRIEKKGTFSADSVFYMKFGSAAIDLVNREVGNVKGALKKVDEAIGEVGKQVGHVSDRLNSVGDDLQTVTVYPVPTQPNKYDGADGTPGIAGVGSLDLVVKSSLRQTLGWPVREDDAKGFVAALDKSFVEDEVDGRKLWKWIPHTYMIQSNLGEISGAQASIFSRAQWALEQALPLLDGLTALRPDADEEDMEAIRSIVRSDLQELVNELGNVGGPRVHRVDAYFEALLNETKDSDGEVEGELGQLQVEFGLTPEFVLNAAEEAVLTNFLILVDHAISLHQSWKARRKHFTRSGGDAYLGTQLVLLSRSLAVIGETTSEVKHVLDSVYFGQAERESIQILVDDDNITIAEALDWAEYVANVEGLRLIRDAGKKGVSSLIPMLKRLGDVMKAIEKISKRSPDKRSTGPGSPPKGFYTSRVNRVLADMVASIRRAQKEAKEIKSKKDRS